jgi:dihydrofolate reductase
MSTVVFDMSLSVDGYVTAANQSREEPLGEGGTRLHEWARDATGQDVLARGLEALGAVICGRRTYDDSLPAWNADGPTGDARVPVFVVTHSPPPDPPDGGVYTFATGVDDALAQAREAAAGKTVCVMGGPTVGNQYLRAGLVDELSIHLAPVLFGDGTRLSEVLPAHIRLEPIEHIPSARAVHLRYNVVRPS